MTHWLKERAPLGLDVDAALASISEHLKPQKLAPEHPLRVTWENASDRGARELALLGNDVHTAAAVPGAKSLFKGMREDVANYRERRYELRIAGHIGRAPEQRLTRLGGPAAGPDVQFVARSGHPCGVACYSAKSANPTIENLRKVAATVAQGSLPIFAVTPINVSRLITVGFDAMPVSGDDTAAAQECVSALLTQPTGARIARGPVSVASRELPPHLRLPTDLRRTRLRFAFHTRPFEENRVREKVREKIGFESESWARTFKGVSIFCVEETDGCAGTTHPQMSGFLEPSAFTCGVVTYYPAESLESIEATFRETATPVEAPAHIEFRTVGESVQTWRCGEAMATLYISHSLEDWDLSQSVNGCVAECVTSLSTFTQLVRLGHHPDLKAAENDAGFRAKIDEANRRMTERALTFERAPDLLLPLHRVKR